MTLTRDTTVGEIAGALPRAIPIFQRHGIDFCCGGRRALGEVCSEKGVPFEALVLEIETAGRPAAQKEPDWGVEPLGALIDHILERFHRPMTAEMARLGELAERVAAAHGARHPEIFPALHDTFEGLEDELVSHMAKEEHVLFPYVRELEAAARGLGAPHGPALGGVIGVMEREHEAAGLALTTLRRITGGYRPPEEACASFRALYAGLEIFESELEQHIHLENNILFPRAEAIERRIRGSFI